MVHSHLKLLFFVVGLFLNSCVPNQQVRGRKAKLSSDSGSGLGQGATGKAPSAGPGNGSVGNTTDEILRKGKQEIRHIVDPFDGTYKTKVTIPKNYKGLLYLSGLNISSLADRLVSARFRFGREKEEITVPASIGRAPGITPSTDIEVLILDMENQPFRNIRLLYDLFDYTDYDTNNDQIEFGAGDSITEPINDPRNSGIYCRGLKLEDDPTFQISSTNDQCDTSGERCLYAYAKIRDSGLYYTSGTNKIAINPSQPAVDLNKQGYANESQSEVLKKCLPDTNHRTSNQTTLQTTLTGSNANILSYGNTAFSGAYEYRGPFRTLDRFDWEIKAGALFTDVASGVEGSGLFQYSIADTPMATASDPNIVAEGGIKSFLFPRAGKMDLKANVEYLGMSNLSDPLGLNNGNAARAIKKLVASGKTDFMDGCNIRATNYDQATNEGISSCTVSATIDLIYEQNGETRTLTSSKAVKLQLIRPSLTDYQGREVLYSSLKTCTNSQVCGTNECCFNNRCWGKELVSQCLDDVPGEGNVPVGGACSSDFQCSSLCCYPGTGVCAVHNLDLEVLCSKSPGQTCISKDFCRKENIPTCFIVKTGLNPQGQTTCALRCYNVPTFGECQNGTCQPPPTPTVPDFDPNSEGACNGAIDPPTSF